MTMSLELIFAGIILISLTFYVLLGGADYGAGVWSLFATGLRAPAQRAAIANAIGPIWEANHVWLILSITVLFTAFPKAFAVLSTRLHIPLSMMLIGIVLRGSAFAFRTNDIVPRTATDMRAQQFWERVFALSSVFTPLMVGINIGALTSGRVMDGDATFMEAFVWPWATPFCVAVGVLTLTLFAFLAAVYLMLESTDAALKEDFRRRALWAGAVSGAVAFGVLLISKSGAPGVRYDLAHTTWGVATMAMAALSALAAIVSVWLRKDRAALICTVGEVTLILWGWALAQYPYLVTPDVTIADSAPPATLKLVLVALLAGACVLFPSLYYLYRIFKGGTILRVLE